LKRQTYISEMKAPWTDPGLRELLALAALAAFGCGPSSVIVRDQLKKGI
jgi:hypothetical protein